MRRRNSVKSIIEALAHGQCAGKRPPNSQPAAELSADLLEASRFTTDAEMSAHGTETKGTVGYTFGGKITPDAFQHVAVTCAHLGLSLIIALAVSDLGLVLGVVGATGSTIVSYILPGFCFMRLGPKSGVKHLVAIGMLAAGCVIMPLALTLLFI